MSIHQTQQETIKLKGRPILRTFTQVRRLSTMAILWRVVAVAVVLALAGGSVVSAQEARVRSYSMAVSGWVFDLVEWEIDALAEKAHAGIVRPSRGIEPSSASAAVVDYLARADRIELLEADISRLISAGASSNDPELHQLENELQGIRAEQERSRATVEQIVQRQVSYGLERAGFSFLGNPFPPVQFTFTEPPKKLIISPRDRIATRHSNMLSAGMPVSAMEEAETQINAGDRDRAYITNIGGLGAFPTMVVDRASLEWILSTVAHEWTHNYLALHPLGWNYFKSQDMTTLNETVADIVGDDVGTYVGMRFYGIEPEPANPESVIDLNEADEDGIETPVDEIGDGEETAGVEAEEDVFDFRTEMRETRMKVDRLLAEGQVDEAEAYMERRRQEFVAHGHPLRVLNQAYFAFHGSYGESAASTSPIGPKLRELRSLTPDLKTFMDTVKWFNDVGDLDAALIKWRSIAQS